MCRNRLPIWSLLSSVPETDVGSWAHEIRTVTQIGQVVMRSVR